MSKSRKRSKVVKTAPKPSDCLDDIPLSGVLASLGIADDGWDFLIVGDGSGSTWDRECAWASVSVDHSTGERLVWYGFANRGSVNYAEVKAYEQPLTYIAGRETARVAQHGRRRAINVHIVTDSEYCRTVGSSDSADQITNSALWEQFNCFSRNGISIDWHWSKRNTIGLHAYVDRLSKLVRTHTKQYNLQEYAVIANATGAGKTVYEINPDE